MRTMSLYGAWRLVVDFIQCLPDFVIMGTVMPLVIRPLFSFFCFLHPPAKLWKVKYPVGARDIITYDTMFASAGIQAALSTWRTKRQRSRRLLAGHSVLNVGSRVPESLLVVLMSGERVRLVDLLRKSLGKPVVLNFGSCT
jgi:hypothetical protein